MSDKEIILHFLQEFNSHEEFEKAYSSCNLNVNMQGQYEVDFVDSAWHGFERCLVMIRKRLEEL